MVQRIILPFAICKTDLPANSFRLFSQENELLFKTSSPYSSKNAMI